MSITVENLTYTYSKGLPNETRALEDVSFQLEPGEFAAVIGHTGSGKSTLMQQLNGLLRPDSGKITVGEVCITDPSTKMTEVRRKVGLVFQYPEYQLFEETVAKDVAFGPKQVGMTGEELDRVVEESIRLTGLDYEEVKERSPFELSGGQKRRVAIAGVLAMKPEILILDEPTAGLDPSAHRDVLKLIRRIHRQERMTILLVSHNMGDIAELADRVLVMKNGEILEQGTTEDIFARPKENYTKKLVRCAEWGRGKAPAEVLKPESERKRLASVRHLKVRYPGAPKPALRDCNLDIREGEILGLIGESGCGKSTLAKVLCGILKPSAGEVEFFRPVKPVLIFQDSVASFNERMTLGEIVQEPLVIGKMPPERRKEKLRELTEQVELEEALLDRYPYEVSGGQRQRAAIARGLAMDPEFLIADEPVSSLDAPVQMEILRLLKQLRDRRNLTLLIISHDIPMVEHISDRIIRMEKEGLRDEFK